MEEHCSENGLPERENVVFDVTAISQVSKYSALRRAHAFNGRFPDETGLAIFPLDFSSPVSKENLS